MESPRIITFDLERPGTAEGAARADAAVLAALRRFGWAFEGEEEDEWWTLTDLALIAFSGGTDAHLADYLRVGDAARETPYARAAAEYLALAQELRAEFGAPAV